MSEDLYTALAKLRDNFNGCAMALDELIQQQSKTVLQTYDPEKIKWEEKNGNKGPFQSTDDANNPEYKALREDMMKHNGFIRHKSFQYWLFQNGVTIGRRPIGNSK